MAVLLGFLLVAACSQDHGTPTGIGVQPGLTGALSDGGLAPGLGSPGSQSGDGGGALSEPGSSASGADGDAQAALPSGDVTYQKHIRPVIVGNCVECHTRGGIGPSDLGDWSMVKALAPLIVSAVGAGRMPPWPASDKCHEIADSRALSAQSKELFKQWEAGGYLEGKAADYVAPAARHRQELGPANVLMKAAESFTPGANTDTYRCFYLGTVAEDTYVTALDLIPGDRAEVHHIQLHRVEAADAASVESEDALDLGGGYGCNAAGVGLTSSQNMFSYRPGALAVVLNQGDAVYFKGGSGLILQVHYNTQFLPSGEGPKPDQSSVAMWTLPQGQHPERVVYRTGALAPLNGDGSSSLLAQLASIPANAKNVVGQDTVSMGDLGRIGNTFLKGEIVGMTPHAHSWATRMVASLTPQSGGEECLIDVPDWDFNWQLDYMFKSGVPYTENDTVHIECDYDNTADNQPVINGKRTPVMPITFGEKTLNEMCLHYVWLRFAYADFAAANR